MPKHVLLCQSQLNRLPDRGTSLRASVAECGPAVGVMGCLSLCFACTAQHVARADGIPLAAPTAEGLLDQIRALHEAEAA